MASSMFPNRPFSLRENLWLIDQDIPGNRSLLGWEAWIYKEGTSPSFSNDPLSEWVYQIDGVTRGQASGLSYDFRGSGPWRIGTGTVWIGHDADGTKSIQIGLYATYALLGNTSVVVNKVPLPTIPRATTPELRIGSTAVSKFDAGTALTVFLPRASSTFTHDVAFTFADTWGTIATGAGVSAAWTPPLTLLERIPKATSGSGTIRVITKDGSGKTIGDKSIPFTMTAPASVVPTISALNLTDTNPDVASLIGGLVQTQSRLKATPTAAGAHGSTITSTAFAVDGATAAAGEAVPLPTSGVRAVVATTVDSRGRVGTRTENVTVLPYNLPSIPNFMVERANSAGVPTATGTYLLMTLKAAVSSLIVGTQKNAMTVKVYTRARGTTAWTLRNTIPAGLSYDTTVLITGGAVFATTNAWDVKVEVADKLQKSEDYWSVPTPGAILDVTETQQALGMLVDAAGPASQMRGPARVYDGDLTADGDLRHRGGYAVEPVGIVTQFAGATAPAGWLLCDGAAVSRTTYAALFAVIGTAYGVGNGSSTFNLPNLKGRVPVGRDAAQTEFDVLGETGGAKTVKLTAAQSGVPEHAHSISGRANATASGTGDGQTRGSGSADGGFRTGGVASTGAYGSAMGPMDAAQAHENMPPYLVLNHIIKAL